MPVFKCYILPIMELKNDIPLIIKRLQTIDNRPFQLELSIKMVELKEVENTEDSINNTPIIVEVI